MMTRTVARLLLAGLSISAIACSDGAARQSMTGPSSIGSTSAAGPSAFTTNSATASGRPNRVGGDGTVASLAGSCPDLTLIVRGARVTTSSSTTFTNGECGNLRAGTKVHVEGDYQDGELTAESIEILDQPGGTPVEGDGHVGAVKGTCPTLTMVVSGYPVMTTSSTTFSGTGACEDIKPGSNIHVQGSFDGGSVLATSVELLAAEKPQS